jgi:hypothetical protein
MVGRPPLVAVLWDGQEVAATAQSPLAKIIIHNAATLRRIAVDPFFQFAEAYANGQIDIVGDLVEAMVAINRSLKASATGGLLYKLTSEWFRLPRFSSASCTVAAASRWKAILWR